MLRVFLLLQDLSSVQCRAGLGLELETKVKRRFAKGSIVSYSHLSLMIIVPVSQFYFYLPWGQRLFSIVS